MRALLKANAKENLRGNWGTAILVLLIAHVLLSASSMVVAVGELILLGPLETGVALVFLKLSYREPAEVGDLFQPFQNFVNTFFAGSCPRSSPSCGPCSLSSPASSRLCPIPRSTTSCVTTRNTPPGGH